jgi:hypothetical protein
MADTLNDLIFGPALDDRACGDCVACCVLPDIDTPQLKKPEGQVCVHCTGQGCGIYETRPEVCRSFNCAWKRIASMPPETRPDRLGVMFTLERHLPPRNVFEHLYIAAVAVSEPAALQSRAARDALHMFAEGVLPVFASWAGTKTLIHPEPVQAEAIMNPAPQRDRALVKQGRAWLKRYAPFARAGGGEHTTLPDGL